jgi:hypothetical protein
MWWNTAAERVFVRELPGGGFAAIDVRPANPIWRRWRFRGALVIERRPESRRAGHTPPTIAEATGNSVEAVVQQLLPAAQFNAAIGVALLQWQHQRA